MTVPNSSQQTTSTCTYPNQFAQRSNTISWSCLYQSRRDVAARFGTIWQLPVRRRWKEVLRDVADNGMSVLEIGAGSRHVASFLARERNNVAYFSMDIDRSLPHDYYDLAEIDRTFNIVLAFEVIEHLTLDDAQSLLRRAFDLVAPGGWLLLTTPNTFYPPAFLRDVTHRTPFCYDELGALVLQAGFDVQHVFRIYHDPVWRKLVRRYLMGWVFPLIGIDFARQIMLVARRPQADAGHPASGQGPHVR